jgi:hypothetical protein
VTPAAFYSGLPDSNRQSNLVTISGMMGAGADSYFVARLLRRKKRFTMFYRAIKALAEVLSICSISAGAFSQCSVDVVIVNGRVEHAPRKGIVRVQLVYPKQKQEMGESGDVTVERGSFRIQIPFLTQSRAPGLLGVREKCDRKLETVVVTLYGRRSGV